MNCIIFQKCKDLIIIRYFIYLEKIVNKLIYIFLFFLLKELNILDKLLN